MTYTIVILVSVLAAGILLWLEIRRENRKRLALRILASLILAATVAALFLQPKYCAKNEAKKGTGEAAFLTPGFQTDSLAQLGDSVRYYASDEKLIRQHPELRIRPVFDSGDVSAEPGSIHVFGDGLTGDDTTLLSGRKIVFHPSPARDGIQAVSWPKSIPSGEALTVSGTYQNTKKTPVKLVLEGMGIRLDSQVIASAENIDFRLESRPKLTGRAAFRILALSGKDTLESAPVPFTVEPERKLNLLMLASAPNFENRFLKNWLAMEGYTLALRSRISKGKITQEFVNMGSVSLTTLSPALLKRFDVVIADAGIFPELSGAENAVLKSAVDADGLGMIIKADSAERGTAAMKRLFPVVTIPKHPAEDKLILPGKKEGVPLPSSGLGIRLGPGVQPLLSDAGKHTLAAVALSGRGKQVFSTLTETYTLMLSGDKNSYGAIWSMLIGQAAKRIPAGENLWLDQDMPAKNNRTRVLLETGAAGLPTLMAGNVKIALAQSLEIPYRWSGFYWPEKAGWQQFGTGSGSRLWQYTYSEQDYPGVLAKTRRLTTQIFADRQKTTVKSTPEKSIAVKRPVPPVLFFSAMLISWAFLWIERKLS